VAVVPWPVPVLQLYECNDFAVRFVRLATRQSSSECILSEFDRFGGSTEHIDLEFVERQRSAEFAVQPGIQLHLADLSLSNTKQYFEKLGVE
jgi:hypothetical protein